MPINLDLFIFVNFNESNKLCFNININIKICILNVLKKLDTVRTRFGLNPKTGMDPGPQSPYNKFVKYRIKS